MNIYTLPVCMFIPHQVGEDEEISIKEVADAIVKAIGFEGEYTVIWPGLTSFHRD